MIDESSSGIPGELSSFLALNGFLGLYRNRSVRQQWLSVMPGDYLRRNRQHR
jgi:hypothetical protein